jgi:tape measure domain-containing protein
VAVSVVDIQVNSQGAVRSLNKVGAASKATEGAVNGVKNAVTGLVGAFTAAQAIKFVFAKASELESQTKSLEVLTGSVQKAKSIIAELQQLGAVTPFTSTELIDAAKRLNAFGVEGDKVVETTRRLADVSGATGAELQGLVTAYGQVQAKGRLQGEELLQFQERGIALQGELRKMYGMTGDEFQKALAKGRISAEAVEVAVKRLTDAGGKYANGAIAQSETLQGKFSTLTDGVEQLARTIGVVLAPALKAILTQAIQTLDAINAVLAAGRGGGITRDLAGANAAISLGATSDGIDRIAKGLGQISNQKNKAGIQQNLQALANYQSTLQRISAEDPNANRAVELQGAIQQKIQQNLAAQKQLNAARANIVKPTEIPALLGETGGAKPAKNTAADNAAKAAATEALRLKNALGDLGIELNLKRQIFGIDEKIFQAGLVKDNATVIRLEGEKRLAEINAEILKLENQKLTPLEKQAKAQLLIDDRTNAQKLTQQQLIANQVQVAQQAEAAIRPLIQEGELMQAKLNGTEEEYQKRLLIQQIMRDNPTLQMRDVEAIVTKNQALQRQLTQAEQLKAVYSDIGMTIKSGVVDAIQGAVNGTKSLGEVAANVLSNIANKLLDIAVNMALFGAMSGTGSGGGLFGGLFGGGKGGGGLGSVASNMNQYAPLPGFAAGGTPPVGRPSLVGERGPELFMPGVRGSIIPNDAMGGGSTSVVVNVDASGSSVQGDQAQGRQLGVAISAAVQAELVKQQRPGGLLANTRR